MSNNKKENIFLSDDEWRDFYNYWVVSTLYLFDFKSPLEKMEGKVLPDRLVQDHFRFLFRPNQSEWNEYFEKDYVYDGKSPRHTHEYDCSTKKRFFNFIKI